MNTDNGMDGTKAKDEAKVLTLKKIIKQVDEQDNKSTHVTDKFRIGQGIIIFDVPVTVTKITKNTITVAGKVKVYRGQNFHVYEGDLRVIENTKSGLVLRVLPAKPVVEKEEPKLSLVSHDDPEIVIENVDTWADDAPTPEFC